jgi:hypothetical protein
MLVKNTLKKYKISSIGIVVLLLKWTTEWLTGKSVNVGARFSGNRFEVFDRNLDPSGFYDSLDSSLIGIGLFLFWILTSELYFIIKYRNQKDQDN